MATMFFQVLCLVDQVTALVDPIRKLPTELAETIFRYLDPESLAAASTVSRDWSSVCKSSRVLRTKIRRRLRQQRKERQRAYLDPSVAVQVTRTVPGVTFGRRNGQVTSKALPVQFDLGSNRVEAQGQFKVVRSLKEQPKRVNIAMSCSASVRAASKKKSFTYSRLRL